MMGLQPGLYLYDGIKARPLDAIAQLLDSGTMTASELAYRVAWSYIALRTRRAAIEQFDFVWRINGNDTDTAPMALDWTETAGRIDEAISVYGAAYLFKERNARGRVIGLRWLDPRTMTLPADAIGDDGTIEYYERSVNGRVLQVPGTDVVRIYETGMPEVQPGVTPSMATAYLLQTIYNTLRVQEFATRNPVPLMLLEVPAGTPDVERSKLRAWFHSFFNPRRGDDVESRVMPITAGVNVHKISLDPKDLTDAATDAAAVRAVLAAFGVPEEEIFAAANYATAQQRHKSFMYRLAGAVKRYAGVINADPDLRRQGVEIVPRPETHPDMQVDENERAQAMAVYVKAGLTPQAAGYLVGITAEQFPAEIGGPFVPVAPVQAGAGIEPIDTTVTSDNKTEQDLERWQRKAINALKRRGSIDSALEFESERIEPGLQSAISAQLAECKTAEDVRRVFAFAEYP